MNYSAQEVLQYIEEEDVKFIRLAFCDIYGKQKNISIMSDKLSDAFKYGVAIDASAIDGFGNDTHYDLFLHPDPSTITVLPWRPEHGRVVRMFCDIKHPDGSVFEHDIRALLKRTIANAKNLGYTFSFGSEIEFYLFKLDEYGNRTVEPYDNAGYMDIAPDDKGENVRREICLTLEQMGISPECSHHEEGPGQNEIVFKNSDPLTAADNAITFCSVVKTISAKNGLYADFSPRPLAGFPGNGFHINISVNENNQGELLPHMISGLLNKICDMTLFLNPSKKSYDRFGTNKAPLYISWSKENRSQLIRIPSIPNGSKCLELRSADPTTNPYIAFTLLISACIYGIENKLSLPESCEVNINTADEETLSKYKKLPLSIDEAIQMATNSEFITKILPSSLIDTYCKNKS